MSLIVDDSSEREDILRRNLERLSDLWVTLTGYDPSVTRFRELSDWDVNDMSKEIIESIELDPTNVTAYLLLDTFARAYFKDKKFSVEELLKNPQGTQTYLTNTAEFMDLLAAPEVIEIGQQFADQVKASLAHYEVPDAVIEVVDNRDSLAMLRRDALRSMQALRVDQFTVGQPDPEGTKPVYIDTVHQWWNVNSLLRAVCKMPSGVSVNLIRDPERTQSYFVLAIRNGGNIYLVSDQDKTEHPLQRFMSRRPDRKLGARVARNWFPYDLLGIKFDEEGELLPEMGSEAVGLVAYQSEAVKLCPINKLNPPEVIWLAMMFDLTVQRFWRHAPEPMALSYTGEMVKVSDALSIAAQSSNLPVIGYSPLLAEPLTVAALRSDVVSEKAIGPSKGHPNKWLEDHYASRVPDSMVNLVLGGDKTLLIKADGQGVSVAADGARSSMSMREESYEVHSVDPTSFAPAEQMLENRIFIGRHNLAIGIQKLADQEYNDRKKEVEGWYKSRLEANESYLLNLSALGNVILEESREDFLSGTPNSRKYVFIRTSDNRDPDKDYPIPSHFLHSGFTNTGAYCRVDGTKATFQVSMIPRKVSHLMLLTGCEELEDLPDVLRHWQVEAPYTGNHILRRIDPMCWALTNPWEKTLLDVSVFLSIRAMNRLRKEHEPVDIPAELARIEARITAQRLAAEATPAPAAMPASKTVRKSGPAP